MTGGPSHNLSYLATSPTPRMKEYWAKRKAVLVKAKEKKG